jgi:hypothetical protein
MSFNKHSDRPRVWSIWSSAGTVEFCVTGIETIGVRVVTVFKPKEVPDDDDGIPSAWIECTGKLFICPKSGHAVISQ